MTGPNHPVYPRVEYRRTPNNVPPASPRFSWRMANGRGRRQVAFQIIVGRSPEVIDAGNGNVWDSGRVESSRSTGVIYRGPPLDSDTTYYWSVRLWDEGDRPTEFCEPELFRTALEDEREWSGSWISHQPEPGDTNGYRSQWQSARHNLEPEWVQIDTGSVRHIEEIEVFPAGPFDTLRTPEGFDVTPNYSTAEQERSLEKTDKVWGFGFPVRYRIDVADELADGAWRTVVDRTEADQPNPGSKPVTFEVGVQARYVRMTTTKLYAFDPAVSSRLTGGPEESILGSAMVRPDRMRQEASTWRVFALCALAVRDDDGNDLARRSEVQAKSSVEDATWGTGKLVDGEYQPSVASTAPRLRTEVKLSKSVATARAHVSLLGYGEMHINGQRVGDDVLSPEWTNYDDRILYSTYDVGEFLNQGTNAIGLWLGRGFFSKSALQWTGHGAPRGRLQLNIEYEDGSSKEVVTDTSWTATSSPIVENDVYDGVRYDARLAQDGWTLPGFDDDSWSNAVRVAVPNGELTPRRSPPVRVVESFSPEGIETRDDGVIVDFGRNLTGWIELTIHDPPPGSEVTLRHAEILDADGRLSTVDLGGADATDTYVTRGDDEEIFEPRFTYHGFQFVHVSGYPQELSTEDIVANSVHTDMTKRGSFECSNADLTAVQDAAVRSLRGNSVGIPTDCPQRAERFGWTCDAHVSAGALLYNYDAVRFYEQWLQDFAGEQTRHGCLPDTVPFAHGTKPGDPSWTLARVVMPWYLYQFDGNRAILEEQFEGMRSYVDYWHSEAEDHIVPEEYGNYGDWLALEHQDADETRVGQPVELFNTASHYRATAVLARIASVLGRESVANQYRDRVDDIGDAFNNQYLDRMSATYRPGSQAANAIPLHFGLTPPSVADDVARNLAEMARDGMKTGFIGTSALLESLVDYGYENLAYDLVSNPERPGWVYMVNNAVNTTLWERWDSDDAIGTGMNSFNHQYRACISEWFYRHLAGMQFDPNGPGASKVTIRPVLVDDLNWARGWCETPLGELGSHWRRTDSGYVLTVTIPWNSMGTVRVPLLDSSSPQVAEDGRVIWDGTGLDDLPDGIIHACRDDSRVVIEVQSGRYRFDVTT